MKPKQTDISKALLTAASSLAVETKAAADKLSVATLHAATLLAETTKNVNRTMRLVSIISLAVTTILLVVFILVFFNIKLPIDLRQNLLAK